MNAARPIPMLTLLAGAIALTAQTLAPVTVPAPGHGTTN